MKMPLTRYIPAGAQPVNREGVDAVVYVYEGIGARGAYFAAVAYHGKAKRPDWHYSFRSVDKRSAHIVAWLDNLTKYAAQKLAHKAQEKTAREAGHPFAVGDILSGSWGYDQTNAEFYAVVATTKGTVTLRELACKAIPGSEGLMCESIRPRAGHYTDAAPILRRPQVWVDSVKGAARWCVKLNRCCHLYAWEGSPQYSSWYA